MTWGSCVITSSASTTPFARCRRRRGRRSWPAVRRRRRRRRPSTSKAGAVPEDPDRAVELHVGDVLLPGKRLERVGRAVVAKLGDVRMAEERAVVDGELGVERLHPPSGVTISGLISREHRVALDEAAIELLDDVRELLLLVRVLDPAPYDELARDPGLVALERVDVQADECVRIVRRRPPRSRRRPAS